MIQITTVDSQYFEFEGIRYFKNFTPVVRGNRVSIVNTYGNYIVLADNVLFSEIEVNGLTYATVALLQAALLPVIYVRATSGVSSAFLQLTDTPSTYTGQAGKVAKVKSDETGLEFGEGGSPTIAHNDTTGRDASNAHPISSITGLQTALNAKVDKDIIPYTATADFNPLPAWQGQVVEIDLGGVDRTMTIDAGVFFAIIIKGSGILTVVSDAGRTLVEQNNSNEITENATTALVFSMGTTDYLSIKDLAIIDPQNYALNEFNNPVTNPFLRFNSLLPQRGVVTGGGAATTFVVTLPEPYVDSNYDIDFVLNHDNRVWFTSKNTAGFTINTATAMSGSQTVNWKTQKIG